MGFASAITSRGYIGGRKYRSGTYTSTSSSTGGDIDTGLKVVEFIRLQPTGSSVATNASVVNETLPLLNGGLVTIVTDADQVGIWYAIGK